MHVDATTITLLAIAILNAYTAYVTYLTRIDMHLVEKNTNSMKDALVASTAKASLAEGTAAGLERGRGETRK